MMRKLSGVAAALCWIFFWMTLVVCWIAGDGGLFTAEMIRTAPPEHTGLPASEYAGVCRMTAAYLTGRTDTFQYSYVTETGSATVCFREHEAAHMKDCRDLIRLDRLICLLNGIAAALLTAFSRRGDSFRKGVLLGVGVFSAAAAGLLVWAVVDYDGLFITFHRVAFRNDGWLLNPRTDLLIRLMPEKFFIALGIRGLARGVVMPLLLAVAASAGLYREKKKRDLT